MNRRGYAVFGLLTSFALLVTSCQKPVTSASESVDSVTSEASVQASSSASSVVPTSSNQAEVTITLAKNIPSRITLTHKVNLAKYVTVTGADSFSLSTTSTTISIDGTFIHGDKLGDFSVTITAGDKSVKYDSRVVSEEQADIDGFIDTIGDTYEARLLKANVPQIELFHNSKYVKWGVTYTDGIPSYYSAAIGPFDGHYYLVQEDTASTTAEVLPGYQYSAEQDGLGGAIRLSSADIVDTENSKVALTDQAKVNAFLTNAVSTDASGITEIDFSLDANETTLTGDVVSSGTSTGYTVEISQVGTWSDPVLDAYYADGGFTAPDKVSILGYKSAPVTDQITDFINTKEYCEDILFYWSGNPTQDVRDSLPEGNIHYWVKDDNSFISDDMSMSTPINFTSYNKGSDGKFYKSTGVRSPRSDSSGTWNWAIKTKEESEKGPWEMPEVTIKDFTADAINALNVTFGFANDNSSTSGPVVNTNFMSYYSTNALGDNGAFYEKLLHSSAWGVDVVSKAKAFAAAYFPAENWYDVFTLGIMEQKRGTVVSGTVQYAATVISLSLALRQLIQGCNWGMTVSLGLETIRPTYASWCNGLAEALDAA